MAQTEATESFDINSIREHCHSTLRQLCIVTPPVFTWIRARFSAVVRLRVTGFQGRYVTEIRL